MNGVVVLTAHDVRFLRECGIESNVFAWNIAEPPRFRQRLTSAEVRERLDRFDRERRQSSLPEDYRRYLDASEGFSYPEAAE
jgi:hypothetical protein